MLETLKAAADRTNAAYWAAPSRETLEAALRAQEAYGDALQKQQAERFARLRKLIAA